MADKLIEKIMVEIDGELINIVDLPKPKYEYFLELTRAIRIEYISALRLKT